LDVHEMATPEQVANCVLPQPENISVSYLVLVL